MPWNSYNVTEPIKIEKLHSLFKKYYEKGFNFAGETHDFWEILYVIDGEVIVSADENVYNFKSGDIIFHKPLELHKFSVIGEEGATLLIFSFSMHGEFCKNAEHHALHIDKYGRYIVNSFIEFLDEEVKKKPEIESKQSFTDVLPYFADDKPFLQTVAVYIYRIVLSLTANKNALAKTKNHETEIFKKALNIMDARVTESLSVSELADALNLSVSSLKRLFDKYAGMSVHKYFLTLKIKAATLMLKEGLSVSDVSDRLGFSSQGYFSATYKRETGVNPSQI